jgi:hypothetical protein
MLAAHSIDFRTAAARPSFQLFVSFFTCLEITFNALSFDTWTSSEGPRLTLLWPFFVLGTIACLHQLRTSAIHPVTNSLLLFLFLFQLETAVDYVSFDASFAFGGLILTPLWRYTDSCHNVGCCPFLCRRRSVTFSTLTFISLKTRKWLQETLFWLTCLQGPCLDHSVKVFRILAICFDAGNLQCRLSVTLSTFTFVSFLIRMCV